MRVLFGAIFSIALLVSNDALAYLDPGTGSYVLQMLLAGLFGGLFMIKLYFRKIKEVMGRYFGKKPSDEQNETDSDGQKEK